MSAEVSPRRRFLLAFAICAILGGLGGLTMAELQSDPEARPRFIPPREEARDFRLRDQDGDVTTLWDVRGDVVVMTFIYTTCWDLCPAEAATMMKAVEQVGDGVTAFAISVDPVGDTPANVRRFLAEQHMARRMRYLTGTAAQLAPVWRAYGVQPETSASEHTASTVIDDGGGRQRVGYLTAQLTPEGLSADLRALSDGARVLR